MKKVLSAFFLFAMLCTTAFAQWNYLGPWPNADYKGGTHGIAVSPDGKVWQASYYQSKWVSPSGDTLNLSPVYVFNSDGSFVTSIGITSGATVDTLKGNCRGLAADNEGNILYVQSGPAKLIKFNYQTLESMGSRLVTETGSSPTGPAVDQYGTIYIGPVVGGNGKQIATYSTDDLSYLGAAVLDPPNIARDMTVSPDGLTIYWTMFTGVQGINVYTRPSELDAFAYTDSLFRGMSIETAEFQPGTGLLWISNDSRGLDKSYSHLTWYGVDPATNQIVNSFTLPKPDPTNTDEYPRGLAFSPDGSIAYVGLFGTVFDRIYKFEAVPLTEYTVTFQVDMGVQAFEGTFDPVNGKVVIRGDFQSEAGDPGGDWQGDFFEMSDLDGDTIYTKTVTFPLSEAGKTFEYKYVIQPGNNWESTPNRTFTITLPNQTLQKVWFNNDQEYTVIAAEVTNTIEFTADINSILGVGIGGAFDANQDSLLVMGLDWDNFGKNVVGNRRMFNTDPFNSGIYTTTLTVTSASAAPNGVGDSTKWKFKAYPDGRFSNTGWETGADRWHYYVADGSTVTLPVIVPRIFPLFGPISNDVPITFNVDMTGAKNRYNGEDIPLDQLEFVGMRGGADFLGNWSSGGNWAPSDTLTGLMKVLHKVSGNLWSITVTATSGTNAGNYEYKFAAMYPGATDVNGGSSPLDNEGGFGINHSFVLSDKPSGFVLNNIFGVFTPVGVEKVDGLIPAEYELSQNYPNPFNPSTTIRYSIPEAGYVTVKVFNLLGQEVATLVNTQQATGAYEVNFDASQLSSGIYFYSIEVNNFTATKKMILMK